MAGKVTVDLNSNDDILVSAGVLAKLARVSQKTINNYDKDDMPFEKRGARKVYPVRQCLEWMIFRGKITVEMETSDDVDRKKLPPDYRKDLADAELKEHKLAVLRGEYVSLEEVTDAAVKVITNTKTMLLPIGTKLAPVLAVTDDPSKVKQLIDDSIYGALENLAQLEDDA